MATVIAPYQPSDWQDLAQEGLIAMWRALETYDPEKGAEATYLTTAAKLRMRDVVRRQTWTGTPGQRGHTREAPARPVEIYDVHSYLDPALDAALTAYHRSEIRAALDQLTPKDRAYITTRILADAGRYSWRLASIPAHVRTTLADRLKHLEQ
jgi:RNA polymerase sigma factor (sigma-70 family)